MTSLATTSGAPALTRTRAGFLDDLEPVDSLLPAVELARLSASRRGDSGHRSAMGQFLTPSKVGAFMAAMFGPQHDTVRLLDAGAGIGSLSAAFAAEMCGRKQRPEKIQITAYEIDSELIPGLVETLDRCQTQCRRHGIELTWEVLEEDFIESGAAMLGDRLFDRRPPSEFDCAILNPPYRKIRSGSRERHHLRSLGIETSNLYAGFLAIAVQLLRPGGELVAITPRSFCNGPYFKPFRRLFLDAMSLNRIHVYESRSRAFQTDNVLQENIIYHASKRPRSRRRVVVSSNQGPEDRALTWLELNREDLVEPADPNLFIRVVTTELERQIARRMGKLTHTLDDLEISVSTGRVVDFRARSFLRQDSEPGTVPLIYPSHFNGGFVSWPNHRSRKPNALVRCQDTEDLLVDSDAYVLAKRFSTKEERRRLVAAVFDPERIRGGQTRCRRIGFENHLNYYHRNGTGLPPDLARGLAAFLNSTLVDAYFRQFNGHTQVNATDLRSLGYPSRQRLEALGRKIAGEFPGQERLDDLIDRVLKLTDDETEVANPVSAKKKIEQALTVLKDLGLPKTLQNERSGLVLLALLDLAPGKPWRQAENPLRGITRLMEFMAAEYGKTYAPNTRETVRKDTVHHFVQAGLATKNPDDPTRPTNSPKTVYQISPIVLKLLRTFGSKAWPQRLERYLASAPSLRRQYSRERRMERIPLRLPGGKSLTLSPGGQSRLVKKILDDFCALFTPGAEIVYVGDTADKWAFFDQAALAELGIELPEHGKIPDVVVFHPSRNWLVLIEAVTSRGPMDAKRQMELRELFLGSTAELIFVTAFQARSDLAKHLSAIAWETEVWIAETPAHLIHFDGDRFLGPYRKPSGETR